MTKIILPVCAIMLFAISAYSQMSADSPDETSSGQINFTALNWAEVIAASAESEKIIFLSINASWCRPCRLMKQNTYKEKEVAELFNEHFINVLLDGELDEGKQLALKYKIKGYPTLLLLDQEGNELQRAIGYHNAQELIAFANKEILKTRTK